MADEENAPEDFENDAEVEVSQEQPLIEDEEDEEEDEGKEPEMTVAAADTSESVVQPRTVYVRVIFLKIGDIDTVKEKFSADVFIQTRWREPTLDGQDKAESEEPVMTKDLWNPSIVIDNASDDMKENITTSILYDSSNWGAFLVERRRVKATFHETMELFNFPFDTQDLTVTLTSELPSTEVLLEEDPQHKSTINMNCFSDAQEWRLFDEIQTIKNNVVRFVHLDPSDTRPHSTFSCRTNASRKSGFYIYSIFLMMLLIISLAFCTFAIDYTQLDKRISLTFVLLLTTVSFKFAVSSSLPRISYLTTLDVYILSLSIMLITICIWHALVNTFSSVFGKQIVTEADRIVLGAGVVGYIIGHITFAATICIRTHNLTEKYESLERKHKEALKKEKTPEDSTRLQDSTVVFVS